MLTSYRVVLQSFCPTGKSVKSVTVYLSDFGKLKLEEESRYGVRGIWKRSKTSTTADDDNEGDEDEDDDDGDVDENDDSNDDDDDEKSPKNKGDFNRRRGQVGIVMHDELVAKGVAKYDKSDIEEAVGNREAGDIQDGVDLVALRRYELSKLRYYFAIAECDSVQTADAIYNEVDGLEMENSAMVFDCRFVPDDVRYLLLYIYTCIFDSYYSFIMLPLVSFSYFF